MKNLMNLINVGTWNGIYTEGRSLLVFPDEVVVSFLNKNRGCIRKGVDIACGAGRHTILMAQMGIEALGIDGSKAAIDFAEKRAKRFALNNITFQNELVQNLEFPEELFDLVICWGLFHYLSSEEQDALVKKIWKILKPKGFLLGTLRSTEDSRIEQGKKVNERQYLINYFDPKSKTPKKTMMEFWDKTGVEMFLQIFADIRTGHRIVEPIGELGNKAAHWLFSAQK